MRFCATIVIASFKRNDVYFQLTFVSRGHFDYFSCHEAMFAFGKLQQLNLHGLLDIWHLIALFCVRMNYSNRSAHSAGPRTSESFPSGRRPCVRFPWNIVRVIQIFGGGIVGCVEHVGEPGKVSSRSLVEVQWATSSRLGSQGSTAEVLQP